jgi:malate dehydrogenase (oxaloacetate-decarboxylating)
MAGWLAAVEISGVPLVDQRIVTLGAGSAATALLNRLWP